MFAEHLLFQSPNCSKNLMATLISAQLYQLGALIIILFGIKIDRSTWKFITSLVSLTCEFGHHNTRLLQCTTPGQLVLDMFTFGLCSSVWEQGPVAWKTKFHLKALKGPHTSNSACHSCVIMAPWTGIILLTVYQVPQLLSYHLHPS